MQTFPKFHPQGILFTVLRHFLALRRSPEQIAQALATHLPKKAIHCACHTRAIYNCIYAQSVGEFKCDLIAALPHAYDKRASRKGHDRRCETSKMLSVHLRPTEIEDHVFPSHWEGDLAKGVGNASAVGMLAERNRRLHMLNKQPEYKPASTANVQQVFSDKQLGIA